MGQPSAGIVGYQRGFELLFASVYALDSCKLDRYFDEVQIQYVPPYSYGEEIAALIESGSDRLSLASSFARFAERLTGSADAWTELPRSSVPVQEYEKSMQESERLAAALHSSKRAGRGWLISTGIMVGTVGILAAVALPAYQDYATRAKLVEGLLVGSDAKLSVGSFFADHGRLPQLAAELAPLQPKGPIGKYIKRISVQPGGVIAIEYSQEISAAAGKSLLLRPELASGGGALAWVCDGNGIPARYLTASCRQ